MLQFKEKKNKAVKLAFIVIILLKKIKSTPSSNVATVLILL
jgi:hypothetical protein